MKENENILKSLYTKGLSSVFGIVQNGLEKEYFIHLIPTKKPVNLVFTGFFIFKSPKNPRFGDIGRSNFDFIQNDERALGFFRVHMGIGIPRHFDLCMAETAGDLLNIDAGVGEQ